MWFVIADVSYKAWERECIRWRLHHGTECVDIDAVGIQGLFT